MDTNNLSSINLVEKKWEVIRLQIEAGKTLDDIYMEFNYHEFMTSDEFKSHCYSQYLIDKEHPGRYDTSHAFPEIKKHRTNIEFIKKEDKKNSHIAIFVLVLVILTFVSGLIYFLFS